MDLYIVITDENGKRLRAINIWENGDDSEAADEIAEDLLKGYDGARVHNGAIPTDTLLDIARS